MTNYFTNYTKIIHKPAPDSKSDDFPEKCTNNLPNKSGLYKADTGSENIAEEYLHKKVQIVQDPMTLPWNIAWANALLMWRSRIPGISH